MTDTVIFLRGDLTAIIELVYNEKNICTLAKVESLVKLQDMNLTVTLVQFQEL